MKLPIMSDAAALKAQRQGGTWKPGWYMGRIDACLEKVSQAGNDCFEWSVIVRNAAGDERTIRDFGVATPFGMLKLKHCIEAVGAGDKYEAGEEITQEDFPGRDLEVKLAIEKKRGFRDRNIIEDYRPTASGS